MSPLASRGLPPESVSDEERYGPESRQRRQGIGLCLSGGGYRAALFHLGALRRLNELDVLRRLRTVSSVSGGSIAAAHLATVLKTNEKSLPWPGTAPIPRDAWERLVSRPLRAFTSRNIRTAAITARLLPWNWIKDDAGVETLVRTYERDLTPLRLTDLPDSPDFIVCATDMAYGANWIMRKGRMGDWQTGYTREPSWTLGRAVAASACFPPVFNPMRARLDPATLTGGEDQTPERVANIRGLRLTDGGNYDNMGLEPIWKNHELVLVSDAGGLFAFAPDNGLPARVQRYQSIQEAQTRALRKRWLMASYLAAAGPDRSGRAEFGGAYWSVAGARTSYDPGDTLGYSKALVRGRIMRIRTDLDAFSDAEAKILENHGYWIADAAVTKHAAAHATAAALDLPHPEWPATPEGERRIDEALKGSGKRTILGRW